MKDSDFFKELERLSSLKGQNTRKEEEQIATKDDIKLANLREDLEGKRQDRRQRGNFAGRIFILMCVYLAVVLCIVVSKGFCWLLLDNTVINVLLTTTTANVIGIFIIVAKYLFHR